jgi:K+-transporting ATPase KdpF subunit
LRTGPEPSERVDPMFLLLLSLAAGAYLVYAMIRPEKF